MYRVIGIVLIIAGIVLAGFTPLFNPSCFELYDLIIKDLAIRWAFFGCGIGIVGVGVSLIYAQIRIESEG